MTKPTVQLSKLCFREMTSDDVIRGINALIGVCERLDLVQQYPWVSVCSDNQRTFVVLDKHFLEVIELDTKIIQVLSRNGISAGTT
jgi:hypothetical protein